jgi:hypothetical protein
MSFTTPSKPTDTKQYLERSNVAVSNANLFISNNANPFLISPYSPPANLVRTSQLQSISSFTQTISSLLSSVVGDLSSIINITDYTLSISTITNIPTSDEVTVSTTNFRVEAESTFISGLTSINTISSGFIFGSLGNFSTLNISTLTGNYGTFNFLTVNSSINVSSMNATGIISFATMTGSTITANTMSIASTLSVSSINAASSITTKELIFSSLSMNPSNISSGVTTPLHSSILIYLNGSYWKIPIEPA